MRGLLTLGRALETHARLEPDKIGASDLDREMSFALWDERADRLANALIGLVVVAAVPWISIGFLHGAG